MYSVITVNKTIQNIPFLFTYYVFINDFIIIVCSTNIKSVHSVTIKFPNCFSKIKIKQDMNYIFVKLYILTPYQCFDRSYKDSNVLEKSSSVTSFNCCITARWISFILFKYWPFEMTLNFWKKKKVSRSQIWRIWGWSRTHTFHLAKYWHISLLECAEALSCN